MQSLAFSPDGNIRLLALANRVLCSHRQWELCCTGKPKHSNGEQGHCLCVTEKKRAPHIAGLTKYDFESHNTRLVLQCLSMKLWSFRRTILLLSCICLTNSRFCCPQNHLNVTQEASLGKSFGKVSTFDRNGQDCECRK